MAITYAIETIIDPAEMADVFRRSGLAERRPVDDAARMAAMAKHANLTITARDGGLLVGIARSLTDFSFCCYLSDLATDRAYQGRGIGRALIDRTKQAAGDKTTLLLVAAPGAMSYYEHIGMERQNAAWTIRGQLT